MGAAFLVTMREGLEIGLIVGIVLTYLARMGRAHLVKVVYWAVAAAAGASVLGAVAFQLFGVDPDNEIMEGSFLLAAGLLVGSYVIWMLRAAQGLRGHMEAEVGRIVTAEEGSGVRASLFVFTFLMVLREGIEMVLFLSGLSLTIGASRMENAIGGSLGLLLAATWAVLLFKGGLRLNLGLFFKVTSVILLVLVIKLLATGVHEFSEVGLLPSTEVELKVIGYLARDSTTVLLLAALILLPALAMLVSAWRLRLPEPVAGESAARRRQRVAQAKGARAWSTAAALVAMGLSLGLTMPTVLASGGYDPAPVPITDQGGRVRIAIAELADGHMHKYVHHLGAHSERFFLIQREDGSIAIAFDRCGICPPVGYKQDGDEVICKNCDAPINVATIGVTGGCNPVPLPAAASGEYVEILVSDLHGSASAQKAELAQESPCQSGHCPLPQPLYVQGNAAHLRH